jgi:putative FmdB family regulatory protein
MPVYGYRCSRGHHFEIQQRITEPPLTRCPECDAPVTRVFYPVGIIFKGGGFYKTDSRGASSDGSIAPADGPKTETKAGPETKATPETKAGSETKGKSPTDAGSSKPATPPPAKTEQKTNTEEGAA